MQNHHLLSQWLKRGRGPRWGVRTGVRLALLILLAVVVAFTVGDAPPATAASRVPAKPANVAGRWNLKVTFPDGHVEPSEVIFNANGVFVNLTPGPGGGRWFSSGEHTFTYVFAETFVVNGTFTTLVEVQQHGVLSEDGKSYTASGSGYVYAPSTGNLIAVNHTTTVATRA